NGSPNYTARYTYTTSSAPTFTAGDYAIGINPASYNGGWITITSMGNMMIVNGASPSVISPLWEESVNVTPNTTYTFTTWFADIYGENNNTDPSPPTLTFQVGSDVLASGFSPSTPSGTWT